MKIFLSAALLLSLLVSCDGKGTESVDGGEAQTTSPTKGAMETTTATGYGKTHEDAYQEAVSQAVSQVCGIEVAKAIIGIPGGGKNPTTDDKGVAGGISFDGVVHKCKVISEEQMKDGLFKVQVEALICPPADLFANRLAITLPHQASLEHALSSGSMNASLAKTFAGNCAELMQEMVGQDRTFVLLDRSSSADDAERGVAASESSRKEERAKTKGVKAADFVVDFTVSQADDHLSQRHFSVADRTKYERVIDIAFTVKAIDVTTGGILMTQSGTAHGQGSGWNESTCTSQAVSEAQAQLRDSLQRAMRPLLLECKQISK